MRFTGYMMVSMLLVGASVNAQGGDTSRTTPDVGSLVPVPGQSFRIGAHEITREQWTVYVNATGHDNGEWNSSFMPQGERLPVQNVSFEDIEGYLAWLNATLKPAKPFRLPTSKEWEVAARGGAQTAFPWGEEMRNIWAWVITAGTRWVTGPTRGPVGADSGWCRICNVRRDHCPMGDSFSGAVTSGRTLHHT